MGLEGRGGGGRDDFDSGRFGLRWNCVSLCFCVPWRCGGSTISSSDVQSMGETGETGEIGETGDTTVSFFGFGGSLDLAGVLCIELAGRRANRSSESDQSQSSFAVEEAGFAGTGFLGVSLGLDGWKAGVGLLFSSFLLLTIALGGVEMASTRTTGVAIGETSRWREFRATSLEEIVLLSVTTL